MSDAVRMLEAMQKLNQIRERTGLTDGQIAVRLLEAIDRIKQSSQLCPNQRNCVALINGAVDAIFEQQEGIC